MYLKIKSPNYTHFILNLVFFISGIAVFIVGVKTQAEYNQYRLLLDQTFIGLSTFLIITGILTYAIFIFGLSRRTQQNYHIFLLYAGLMVMIFLCTLTIIMFSTALFIRARTLTRHSLSEVLPLYAGNDVIASLVDQVQKDFQCCGVHEADDWPKLLDMGSSVPMSCCDEVTLVKFSCNTTNAYKAGCAAHLGDWAGNWAFAMGNIGFANLLIQLVVILGMCWLFSRGKTEDIQAEKCPNKDKNSVM